MLLALVFGFLCSPHMFEYDISMVRVLVLMAGGTVTMWLISQHARSARFVIYFIAFSLLGHWAEMLFCQLIIAGVFMGDYDPSNAMLWSQWLFPFTAEGAAAVAIVLLLHPASRWLVKKTEGHLWIAILLSFLLNALVCTGIDFTTGMIANRDYSLWDYRALPFNFMGQVCLQNSITYSIAATLIVWVFYPLMDTALRRMPRGVANALAFGLFGMYLFLAMLYFFDIAALFGGWRI